jgi:hypothetical protein
MTQRVFVALLTVVVFVAGYLARLWTEPRQAVPPAPAALAKEYARSESPASDKKNDRQLDRAKLLAEIQKLRPQIEAYSTQVDEIYAEFDRVRIYPPSGEVADESEKRANATPNGWRIVHTFG